MLVKAFETRAVSADAVHARRGVAGEFDPVGLEWMKLRMNHRAREWNETPSGPIRPAHDQSLSAPPLTGRGNPLALRAQRAFAQLRPLEPRNASLLKALTVDLPHATAADEENASAVGMNGRRERMD